MMVDGKKLWGTPLKLHLLKERVAELENENAALKQTLHEQDVPLPYELEVWNTHGPIDPITGCAEGHRWRHFHAREDEWLYHDEQTLYADLGYGQFVIERFQAMLKSAFGDRPAITHERLGQPNAKGYPTFSELPPFNPQNRLTLIVKVSAPKGARPTPEPDPLLNSGDEDPEPSLAV